MSSWDELNKQAGASKVTVASSWDEANTGASSWAEQERKRKEEEEARLAQVPETVEPVEAPRQKGEYRGNIFQKLGQSYFDVLKSVPSQTARGVGMVFNTPENVAGFASDQLMKNDSYSKFMEDAARGIDLGKGRAAVGMLNVGALGIGDLKPLLNTQVGKDIATNTADKTSNLPIKAVAGLRAIGEGTYKQLRDEMIAERDDPENGNVEKFLYELQDSGVQSLVGILVTTGTVVATRNPKAGYAVGGAYYGALSASEQIQSEGEVKSSGNIYIDVIGDSLINNALLGVFKMPAAAVTRVLATGALEGSTEVVQSLLKFGNSYTQAKTDAERQDVLEDAVQYVKSGAILMEFGVGATVGTIAGGTAEFLNSKGGNLEVGAEAATEVLNTAGSEGAPPAPPSTPPPKTPDLKKDIEQVVDLIARADSRAVLSPTEQIALGQARQSFVDYANAFENTVTSIPNEVALSEPPIAEVQVVEVGEKIAVRYAADAGETSIQIDYDLNSLYETVEEANQAALDSILQWVDSQRNNSNVSPVAQKRLEDIAKKLRGEETQAPVIPTKPEEGTAPVDTAKPVENKLVGTTINFGGRQRRITTVVPFGKDVKYLLVDDKGREVWTNQAGIDTAAAGTVEASTETEMTEEQQAALKKVKKDARGALTGKVIEYKGEKAVLLAISGNYPKDTNPHYTALTASGNEVVVALQSFPELLALHQAGGDNETTEVKVDELSEDGTVENKRVVAFETGRQGETKIVVYNADKSEAGEIIALKKAETKYGTTDRTELANRILNGRFDSATDTWTLIQPKKTQKTKVKEALEGNGEASIKDIADITGILEPNIRRILGVGAKSGEFERVDAGVYRLAVDGKDVAFVMAADAVETLPKLAAQGFKADMIFLDVPYETKAVKGGNRGVNYDFLSVQDFRKVVFSISEIAQTEDTPIIHMYSQAESGMKEMTAYNEVFTELGFTPIGKGEWQKTYKDGSPVAFPTRNGSMVTKPEGILVFNKSGKVPESLGDLQFTTVRPKGYQTEKPEEMLKAMIEMTTKEGDVVLDPFAGSGSTGAAAVKAGRRTVAIEKNPDVVENITKPRIEVAAQNKFEEDIKNRIAKIIAGIEGDTFTADRLQTLSGLIGQQDVQSFVSNLRDIKSTIDGDNFTKENIDSLIAYVTKTQKKLATKTAALPSAPKKKNVLPTTKRRAAAAPNLTNTEGDGVVVEVESFGTKAFLPVLEKYKGVDIVKAGEDIATWDGKALFRVGLDDSKMTGERFVDEQANSIETAKAYIDWLQSTQDNAKPAYEGQKLDKSAVDFINAPSVTNGGLIETFDTRSDEPETEIEKLAVKLANKAMFPNNDLGELTTELNQKTEEAGKGWSFVGNGNQEGIEVFDLEAKQSEAALVADNEARQVALTVQYHGTQSGELLAKAIANKTVKASTDGVIGKGFYVTPSKEGAEYFGKQVKNGNSRQENGVSPNVFAIDMSQLKVKVQPFGKQEYYDFLDAKKLAPDQYNQQLAEQGYDALYLEGRGETVIFDAAKVRIYDETIATATVTKLVAQGKPVKAETVKANANTLTIVPDNLDASIEVFMKDANVALVKKINAVINDETFTSKNGEAVGVSIKKDGSFEINFAKGTTEPASVLLQFFSEKELAKRGGEKKALADTFAPLKQQYKDIANIAKGKKLLATGEAAYRPDQLVTKTKLKDFLGDSDRVVFTVLEENDRMYLYSKTDTNETYLRPSALGLVESGLTIGNEVVLDASELKKTGTYLNAVDGEGNVLAEGLFGKKPYDPAKHESYVVEYRPKGTYGKQYIFAVPKGQGAFYRRIIDDARTSKGRLATGHQDVNSQGTWHITSSKYSRLIEGGAIYKGEVNNRIKERLQTNKKALLDSYKKKSTEFAEEAAPKSRKAVRTIAENEFAAVSKLVKKAEPAGKRPSSFASREPKNPSKLKDAAMDTDQLRQGTTIEYDKLAKRSEIARVIVSQLNAVVRQGKFRQAAYGIYKQGSDVVRMSKKDFSDREGGSLTTLIHELGHYVDYSHQEFRSVIPKNEIDPLLENYGAGAASVPANKRRSEAFAEFLRYYITIPAEAESRAPEFHKYFVKALEDVPEIKNAFNTAQAEFRRWAEQPATAKVASQISFEEQKPDGAIKQKLNTTLNSIYKDAVNDLHAIDQFSKIAQKDGKKLDAVNDPAILARNMRGWIGRATYFLESGTVGREYWKKGDNGRFYVDKKGKSLKAILQPVEDKGALNDLSVYLVSRRAIELADRGIASGVTEADARVALAEMEAKHKDFAQVSQELDTYQNHLLDYLQESGVLNKDDRAKMQEANKMYTPFFRVHEELTNKGYMGGKAIPTKNPIKRIKGSEKDIIDPIESIVKNTYVLINAAERNNVMQSMAKLANNDKNLGRLFEPVPEDMSKVASVNPKSIVYEALGAKTPTERSMLPPEVQAAIDIVVPETMVNIFRPAMFQKGNVVTVLENGKPKYYELETELYNAIQATEVEEVIAAVKILSYPAQFLRAGATLAPEFMVRNPLRDSIGAAVFSKNGFVPFYDTFRGFASLLKKDEYYDAFVMSGGLQSTIVAQDRNNLKVSRDELLKRSARIKKYVKNPLEVLQLLSAYSEQATRIGEARLALNAGKSPTQAAFDAREVTLDFQRAGAKTRSVNKLSAFFNAKIQGNDKLIRSFIDNPAKSTFKATLYITMPSVILWFLNQDEEGWDEIPQWQKDIYWLVKVEGTWYRIPKPFELGVLFGSIPERFLEYLKENDPAGLQEVSRAFVTGLVPNPLPTGVIPVLENTTNYSFFLDRPIVSDSLQNLPNEDQYSANTSETAKLIGQALNYSPNKVDNLLYGYFAGLGRHTVNSVDAILKGTGIVNSVTEPAGTKADIPVVKAFVVRDPAGSSSNSVNDFYENRSEATKKYNKYKDLLGEGEADKAREYLADNPEIKMYKPLNTVAGQISDIRKLRDQVYKSETMSAEDKRQKIDELNKLMTDTAYRANNLELK